MTIVIRNPDAPRIITVQVDVPEPWVGWHFSPSGQHFISPDRQKITRQRLEGLIWRDAMELRRAGFASRRQAERHNKPGLVKVVQLRTADWHRDTFGTSVA